MLSRLWGWICGLGFGPRHPSFQQLVDWHEGDLDERFLMWATKHVLACPRCRWEAGVIRQLMSRCSEALAESTATPPLQHGVDRLLSLLRDETVLAAVRKRFRANDDLRLVSGLWPYLGSYPLSLLERSVSGGFPFHTEVERLAEVLLGRKAAAALLDSRTWE